MKQKSLHEAALERVLAAIKSGYGGVMPNGNIVDRRDVPNAIPLQENRFLNTPKPAAQPAKEKGKK